MSREFDAYSIIWDRFHILEGPPVFHFWRGIYIGALLHHIWYMDAFIRNMFNTMAGCVFRFAQYVIIKAMISFYTVTW